MLTNSDWDADRFSKHNGVDEIRKKIHDETLLQYGAHIATSAPQHVTARLHCIQKIQKEWDTKEGKHNNTPWEPPRPLNYHQLTKDQRTNAKKMINDKYTSMKQEVQINVVNNISVDNRARLAVHLAMTWYKYDGGSRAAWH
jgi:hypothetical protein